MKYLYYPGCSLKSSGKSYEESLLAVFKALDIQVEEINDWNCCGATSYMAVDELKAFGLAARNLGLAAHQNNSEPNGETHIIAPCSACYLVLLKTQKYLAEHSGVRDIIHRGLQEIGLDNNNNITIRHPLDVLVNDVGYQEIAKRVKNPLKNIKVASYYGCQIIRPYEAFDKAHYPMTMDNLVTALGAEAVDWPLKTRCCGGTLMGTIQEAGLRLNYRLLKEAHRREADVMVTTCPLCQFNLECYQTDIMRYNNDDIEIPVIYFTQLMGIAFGLSKKTLGLQRLLIPVSEVFN